MYSKSCLLKNGKRLNNHKQILGIKIHKKYYW